MEQFLGNWLPEQRTRVVLAGLETFELLVVGVIGVLDIWQGVCADDILVLAKAMELAVNGMLPNGSWQNWGLEVPGTMKTKSLQRKSIYFFCDVTSKSAFQMARSLSAKDLFSLFLFYVGFLRTREAV